MYAALNTPLSANRQSSSLATHIYQELKKRLLVGDFRLGHRLGEVALSADFGASRTPVREALCRLHAEGLVVRLPEGGYSPSAPDLHTVSELYEVRRSLEFTALSRGTHDRSQLAAIRSDWSEMSAPEDDSACDPEFVLRDEDFHMSLALAAGNHALADLLHGVNERIRLVRMQDFLTAGRVALTIVEHLGIVDHLIEGRLGDARSSLAAHLNVSERVVELRAARALSRMVSGGRG